MLGFFKGFLSSEPVPPPPPPTGSLPSSASLLVAEMNRITDEAMLEWKLGEAKREQKRIEMEEPHPNATSIDYSSFLPLEFAAPSSI
jgi:hypothetical protein